MNSSKVLIRVADSGKDSLAMLDIYSHSIQTSVATFEEQIPTTQDFAARITAIQKTYPWLIAELNGQVLGYAYASQHNPRAGYRWTVEVSAYVDEKFRGQGIGDRLYAKLFAILGAQGFKTALAIISTPNAGSESLHAKHGFSKIGVFDGIGHKFGKWHETCWWQANIGERQPSPHEPVCFADFRATDELLKILNEED